MGPRLFVGGNPPKFKKKEATMQQILKDMTLIVAIRTDDSIVMAADGMAFSSGDQGNIPYPAAKLHTANDSWIMGFCGWAGTEVHRKQLEAETVKGTREFDKDIDIGGPLYLRAIHEKLSQEVLPHSASGGTLLLAGHGNGGLSFKVAELPRSGDKIGFNLVEGANLAAYGSGKLTAKWMLQTFLESCSTLQDRIDLTCFAIWNIAQQELTVGRLEQGYAITTALIPDGAKPTIQTLNPEQLHRKLDARLNRLKKAYRSPK